MDAGLPYVDRSRLHPDMNRLFSDAATAMVQGQERKGADLLVQAVRAAPEPWAYGRYFLFCVYACSLEQSPGILNRSDKKVFQSFLNSPDEPALFRAQAAECMARYFAPEGMEQKADYARQVLEILQQVQPEDLDRPLTTLDQPHTTVRAQSQVLADLAQKAIRIAENPAAALSDPSLAGFEITARESCFRNTSGQSPQELSARFEVGGKACDGCGKTLEELGLVRLRCCSQCKMAYYCSLECQRQKWNHGHKQACRKPGDIRPGDIMVIRGLVARPELNDQAVGVKSRASKEGRWMVEFFGATNLEQKQMSVAGDKLFHIRPTA